MTDDREKATGAIAASRRSHAEPEPPPAQETRGIKTAGGSRCLQSRRGRAETAPNHKGMGGPGSVEDGATSGRNMNQ